MKVWALLSWFEERPDWLARTVESVAPLVDGVVAVDGPFPLTPHEHSMSGHDQYDALHKSCGKHGLELDVHAPGVMPEVDKRAFMFWVALNVAVPMRDWFLLIDGDMYAGELPDIAGTRRLLARTRCHAAEITFHNLDPVQDSNPKIRPFRSLFRAIPGLTVDGTHSNYTVPDFHGRRLLMWQPLGDLEPVEALDLTGHIHLFHRPHLRDPERQAMRAGYYDQRATAGIEQVPDYD